MWKDSIRNIVVIFQPNILRIVGFYVRHSAIVYCSSLQDLNRMNLTAALRNKFFMGWGTFQGNIKYKDSQSQPKNFKVLRVLKGFKVLKGLKG